MGSLIRRVSGTSGVGYGVNLLEQLPPGQIRAGGSAVVGVIGNFPWGPANTVTDIYSPAELYTTFCPGAFSAANDYVAMRAFLGKLFPSGMKVLRIAATDAAIATKIYDDAGAVDSVTVTANYAGLLGNSISVAWSANADTAGNRDATVTIGTSYSVLYENVITSGLVLTDPADPYVTFAKHASCIAVPAVAVAAALVQHADQAHGV